MKLKLNKIYLDSKGQISLEFLLILGVVIIAAVLVGFFLKQSAVKNAQQTQRHQT
jgi:uncharacterized protein (UPF0333 family)